MKRLYDVSCKNEKCNNFMVSEERLMNYDVPPECKLCYEKMTVDVKQGASFHLKGGSAAGYTDDGRVGNLAKGQVRRKT